MNSNVKNRTVLMSLEGVTTELVWSDTGYYLVMKSEQNYKFRPISKKSYDMMMQALK